ncbi:hypothetical protein ABPG75_012682 [Micractinium tetrahymenae]
MAGGGWQHLASSARELASASATKTRAVTATLGKAVVQHEAATSREVRHLVAGEGSGEPGSSPVPPGADGQHVEGPREPAQQGPCEVQDAYGFTLEVTPEQAAILERCRARQEHVRAKWQPAARGPDGLPPPDVLKKLCRKGVPPDLRHQVWLQLSGANARRQRLPPHYYADAALQGGGSPFAHQIELDVPRTFPSNEWVQSEAGQSALRHVLRAFAHHNPRVGYCQSMNYVAAMLLLVLGHDEEDAFWVLASLIDDNDDGILYKDMYASNLNGTHVEMRSLHELVQHKLPRLGAHMDALGCDMSILATDWFLCLFCTSLPAETVARVWDALLNEGPKVLFRVALALLKLHEPLLLAQDNEGELLRATRRLAAKAFDRDALMKVAFEGVGSMPMERINSYRARKQREVDREFAERETQRNLAAAVQEHGFVLSTQDAALLKRSGDAEATAQGSGGGSSQGGSSAAGGSPARGLAASSSVGAAGGSRWVSSLQALGSKAKDTLDRGRMRIAHRRGQSLGASPTVLEGLEPAP